MLFIYKNILDLIKERINFYLEKGMISELVYDEYDISGKPKEVLDLILKDVTNVYKDLVINYFFAGDYKSSGYDADYYVIVFYIDGNIYGTDVVFESY